MDTVIDDGALVARAKAGDFEAFEELVSRHERRLYGVVLGIVRNREDAEDVVQSAFLSALENLEGFREEAAFGTWVSRIATHAALKVLRKRRGLETMPYVEDSGADDETEVPTPHYIADWRAGPEELAQQSDFREVLDTALETLPEGLRLVFVLRDLSGLSVAETAKELGLTEANVKVRLMRARLALREKLTQAFGDDATQVAPHTH